MIRRDIGPKNQGKRRIASTSFRSNREAAEALEIKRLRFRRGLGMQPWRRYAARRAEESARFLDAEARELDGFEISGDAVGAFDQRGVFRGHLRRQSEADVNGARELVLESLVIE